jgi:hypothetical protein
VRHEVNDYARGSRWYARFLDTLGHYRDNPPMPSNLEDFLSEFANLPFDERFSNVDQARNYFILIRIQELFDEKDFADPQSLSTVNRHVILHGIARNYEEFDSLRLFFILELLHEAIGLYRHAASKMQNNE